MDDPARNTDEIKTQVSDRRNRPTILDDWRGRRLAHFEVVEPIGSGGMGAVFKAVDLSLGRTVALKILPVEFAKDPERLARFHLEARAAARLDHENIARVYYCGEDAGIAFIVFEYVEGADLRTLIESRGPLGPDAAFDYLGQIARGLAHAAGRGVIHRDIKPSNIVVTHDGVAKLVDMGLARVAGPADGLTQSGATLGTYDYLSPEQALEPRSADVRSDIYSLGCTFYHAVTGQPPAPAGTAAQKLRFHERGRPADPRTIVPTLPDGLVAILARMMAKAPGDRFQSPEELLESLRAVAPDSDEDQPRIAGEPIVSRRTVLSAVAATLGLVAVTEWARRGRQPVSDTRQPAIPQGMPEAGAPPVEPPAGPEWRNAATVEELERLLRQDVANIRLTGPAYRIDCRSGLKFAGKRLTIGSVDPFQPAEISWAGPAEGSLALLSVTGETSKLNVRGVRWSAGDGIAISVASVEQANLELCVFMLGESGTAVYVGHKSRGMQVTASAVLGGTAFRLAGPTALAVTHGSLVGVTAIVSATETGGPVESGFRFEHCTLGIAGPVAFHFTDGAGADIQLGNCIVTTPADGRHALILQSGNRRGDVFVQAMIGRDGARQLNAYHGLSPFWVADVAGEKRIEAATPEDCAAAKTAFIDSASLVLAWPPCAAGRLPASPGAVSRQIAIDPRMTELRAGPGPESPWLGVQLSPWGRVIPVAGQSEFRRPRVVDPSRESLVFPGTYRTLAEAVADARGDDTILLKSAVPIPTGTLLIDRPDLRLVVQPFPGYRGLMRVDGAVTVRDVRVVFRELHIQAGGNDGASNALMTVAGTAQVDLQLCVVTLDDADGRRMSVITAADPTADRKATPAFRCDRTLIRGPADVLATRAGQKVELSLTDSAVAVAGSLLVAESGAEATIRMTRTTTVTSEPMVDYRAAPEESAPSALRVESYSSAVVSGGDTTLVQTHGLDRDDDLMRVLRWTSTASVFVNWTGMANGISATGDRAVWSMGLARWKALTRDDATALSRGRCAAAVAGFNFMRVSPLDFALKMADDPRNVAGSIPASAGVNAALLPAPEDPGPADGPQ
ncbi:MAG: protein kinase [Gemmataceae bacterium]|nr:protein kinase [Gemmataceae bacterium]